MPHLKRKPSRKPIRTKSVRHAKPERVATELAIVRVPAPAPLTQSVVPSVMQTVKNFERMRRFVASCMNVDLMRELGKLAKETAITPEQRANREKDLRERLEIDWGTIPGNDKPFLKQPGAEKFLFWLMLRPEFRKTTHDLGAGHLEMVCSVVILSKRTGETVFEGPEASCTTMESNYRFRFIERDEAEGVPSKEEAERLKAQGLGRWRKKQDWKNAKKVGERWVWMDRCENPNIWDERNKVRQMGAKRALVKAVKNMGALSELFAADPSEWELSDEAQDAEGSPELDEQYTAGGRRIVEADPTGASKKDEEDALGLAMLQKDGGRVQTGLRELIQQNLKLTQAQRDVIRRKFTNPVSRAVPQPSTAKSGGAVEDSAKPSDGPKPFGLTYRILGDERDERFTIHGTQESISAQRDLLKAFWKSIEKEIIVTAEELDGLKFQFEQRKVPFAWEKIAK